MNDFSLTELIDSVAATAGPDPDEIAAKVEPLIPESERHAVFVMLLARYIVQRKPRLTEVIAAHHHPVRPAPAPMTKTDTLPAARSAKVEAYRAHAKFLRLNVKVGQGERKWMEDCTYADLMYASGLRRDQAARSAVAAEQYEELAALLKRHKVATVGKLPTAVLDAFLSQRRVAA